MNIHQGSVTIRGANVEDAKACGSVLFAAYEDLAARHGFPPDLHTEQEAIKVSRLLLGKPEIYGFVAEDKNGKIVGCNYLDERDSVCSVGPLSVDPQSQSMGIGRRLMEAIMERGEGRNVRLLTDGYNTTSIPLYASLGFEIKEPLYLLEGQPRGTALPTSNVRVRLMNSSDVESCAALCRRVHGFDRTHGLEDVLREKLRSPYVAERERRIVAYLAAAHISTWNHGVAETEGDMLSLLDGVAQMSKDAFSMIIPGRESGLFRWCLDHGLHIVKPLAFMVYGTYREPDGCWFPSIEY
ncbi:MAG: GNAT family N-acetyltransferase [Ktedonobacteraceae bacterium]